jgi:membrane protease YdiL (CAAX protease family)
MGKQKGSLGSLIKDCFHTRQVFVYFVLAFLISWLFWGVVFITERVSSSVASAITGIFTLLVGFGPLFAAMIVIKVNGGRIRHWFHQIFLVKVKLHWYLAALVVPILIFSATTELYSLLGGEVAEGSDMGLLAMLVPLFLWNTLLGGGQEELGWRGFALPKLQEKYPALTASIILGFLHALWHLPMVFLPGTFQANSSFLLYILSATVMAVVFTWLYNNTGSVLPAMIFHGMNNTLPLFAILPSFDPATMDIPEIPTLLMLAYVLVSLAVAIIINLFFGGKRLTRKTEVPTIPV